MATNLKRFTISITPKMEAELDSAKQKLYYRGTQNDMIRDLITRGLATLKVEEAAKENGATGRPEPPVRYEAGIPGIC